MENIYICECGTTFFNPQKFNGHKSHCKVHWVAKGKSEKELAELDILRIKKRQDAYYLWLDRKKEKEASSFILRGRVCEKCGKILTEKYGSGRFCSRSCANSRISPNSSCDFNSLANKKVQKNKEEYYKNPVFCQICGGVLTYENRRRKTCCEQCKKISLSIAARKGVIAVEKRSKNEIEFCSMCENYFKDVEHNVPIFNGWDADVVIHDIKYAVLWNGVWHYEQIIENQSLAQIQTRDKIKIAEIKNCGYTPYIIKDMGGYDTDFVKTQFNIFINDVADCCKGSI